MQEQKTDDDKLDAEMRNIMEEARVILPGVQALFGFQTIAVFNDRFAGLALDAKICHVVGLAMVVITIGMIMTPAIYYRACLGRVTEHMAKVSSSLLHRGVLPLAIGLALEMYTVLFVVSENTWLGAGASVATLVLFASLWYVLPRLGMKRYQPGSRKM